MSLKIEIRYIEYVIYYLDSTRPERRTRYQNIRVNLMTAFSLQVQIGLYQGCGLPMSDQKCVSPWIKKTQTQTETPNNRYKQLSIMRANGPVN